MIAGSRKAVAAAVHKETGRIRAAADRIALEAARADHTAPEAAAAVGHFDLAIDRQEAVVEDRSVPAIGPQRAWLPVHQGPATDQEAELAVDPATDPGAELAADLATGPGAAQDRQWAPWVELRIVVAADQAARQMREAWELPRPLVPRNSDRSARSGTYVSSLSQCWTHALGMTVSGHIGYLDIDFLVRHANDLLDMHRKCQIKQKAFAAIMGGFSRRSTASQRISVCVSLWSPVS